MVKITNTPTDEAVTRFFTHNMDELGVKKANAPLILFVVGISGSGKSTYIEGLLKRPSSINAFPIQADNYRKLHPFLPVLIDKHGIDHAHTKTGNFAKQFAEKLLDKAFKKRCNVVFESTFGNTETAKELILKSRRQGYRVKVLALPMDVSKSIERNQARYSIKQLVENTLPRIVESDVIQRMADNLSHTLKTVEKMGVQITLGSPLNTDFKDMAANFTLAQQGRAVIPSRDDELEP